MTEAEHEEKANRAALGVLASANLKADPARLHALHKAASEILVKRLADLVAKEEPTHHVPPTSGDDLPGIRIAGRTVRFHVDEEGTISACLANAKPPHANQAKLEYDPGTKELVSRPPDEDAVPTEGGPRPTVPAIVVLARLVVKVAEGAA